MITHFLGKEEVAAYCCDLAKRLVKSDEAFPKIWAVLGVSGQKIGDTLEEEVSRLRPDLADQIERLVVRYDRVTDSVEYSGGSSGVDLSNSHVIILDSAIHSGRSMLSLYRSLRELKARHIISYGLVLKTGSAMVPTYFGMVIDDKDRAYFQLTDIPNSRLGHPPPSGILREIVESDVARTIEDVGAPFKGLTVGDLVYDAFTKNLHVYIFERDEKIAGFISFKKTGTTLFIDAWASGIAYRGERIGSATMRWAETWARAKRCELIELWAYENVVNDYMNHGYKEIEPRERNLGDDGKYKILRKKILYNIKPTSDEELKYTY